MKKHFFVKANKSTIFLIKLSIPFIAASILLLSCNKEGYEKNKKYPDFGYEKAFSIAEPDLIPEGIAYDEKTGRFFLSSKNKEKVIAINPDGTFYDFIKTGQDSMLGSLGLKVDSERRMLWALSNKLYDYGKVSAVHIFDADTGALIKRFFAPMDKQHLLNDLILTKEGGAYITDTQAGLLFLVPPDLSELKLFMADPLITSPNGIAIAPDNSLLYVEDDLNGILILNLQDKTIEPIKNIMKTATGGIDGLVYYRNSLIGVVNSQYDDFDYIVRYYLDSKGSEIITTAILDKDNSEFVTPTTAAVANDNLYVLAATCLALYNQKMMDKKELLHNPLILKYSLK